MLNIKKKAHKLIDSLPEEEIAYVIKMTERIKGINISDENPDDFDRFLIKESNEDSDETIALDKFIEELGFKPDELQD